MAKNKEKVVENQIEEAEEQNDWEKEQADRLFAEGQEKIDEIEKIKKKYLPMLTKELQPTKNDKALEDIKISWCTWKHIEALFIAKNVAKEKEVDVTLKEQFSSYRMEAEISFSDKVKSNADLFGKIESSAKFRKDLFTIYSRQY